jgi:hypothetical protein
MITDSEVITLDESLMIQQKGKTVKCLAFIDIIFSFLHVILSPFFAIAALFSLIFGIHGYYGAKNYNKCNTRVYVNYLIIQNIFQIIILFLYIFNPKILNISTTDEPTAVFNTILIFINCYITYFIYSFYSLISNFSQFALDNLNRPENITIIHGEVV